MHLSYILTMFGIPQLKEETVNVYHDNQGVVENTSKLESTLNREHKSFFIITAYGISQQKS